MTGHWNHGIGALCEPEFIELPQSVYDDAIATLARNLVDADEVTEVVQRIYDAAPALSRLLRRTEAHAMSYNDAAELRSLSNYMDGVRKSVEREIEEARQMARWAAEDVE